MRPIDADALREIVEDGLRNNPHKDGYAMVCRRSGYTHFLDVIQRMPTIAPPPNDPLTMEELREMDGEPVYVKAIISLDEEWCIVKYDYQMKRIRFWAAGGGWYDSNGYGDRILAYRRKPEES